MLAHDAWPVGTDMSAAMPIGMAITTAVSTAGMDGVRSTTHGTILHGMVQAIGMILGSMILGTTAIQDGTADGMVVGMVGDHITHITMTGDGMDTIIRFMAEVAAHDTTAQVVRVQPITEVILTDVPSLHSVPDAA